MKALRIIIYFIALVVIAEWCWLFGMAIYFDLQNGTPMDYWIIPIFFIPMLLLAIFAIIFCVLERKRENRWW